MSGIAQIQTEALSALKQASADSYPDKSSEPWRKVRLDGVDVLGRNPGTVRTEVFYSQQSGSPLKDYKTLPSPSGENAAAYSEQNIKIMRPDENSGQWSWLLDRAKDTRDPFELTTLAHSQPIELHIQKSVALRIRFQADSGNLHLPALLIRVDPNKELDLFLEYRPIFAWLYCSCDRGRFALHALGFELSGESKTGCPVCPRVGCTPVDRRRIRRRERAEALGGRGSAGAKGSGPAARPKR